jgi:hypothetical protein
VALKFASQLLKADREVVLAAVTQKVPHWCFPTTPRRPKADRDFVLAAETRNGRALKYASEPWKTDKEVVLAAAKQDGLALEYADSCSEDKEAAFAAVTHNGHSLNFASP